LRENPDPLHPGGAGPERACQVETYSGSRLHERPRRFTWEGEWLQVRQVLKTWYDPENLHFQVAAENGRVFLLRYARPRDTWTARPGKRQE